MELSILNTKHMSSKEIADLTDKRHGNVIRDITNMVAQLDDSVLGHESFQEHKDSRGYTAKILLNKDLTVCLVAGYDANVRFKIIKRWQELESQQAPLRMPTHAEAMRGWADELESHQETKLQLEHKSERLGVAEDRIRTAIEVMTATGPKAKAFDEVLDKGENLLISEAAKVLGTKQHEMFDWLAAKGWIFRRGSKPWQAYADKIQNQLLVHRYTNGVDADGIPHNKCQVMVTPGGIVLLKHALGVGR